MVGISWAEKVGDLKILLEFLDDWKSREEIQDRFNLTPAESYNAIKMLKNYKREIAFKQQQGRTRKAFLFKCRKYL